MTTKQTGQSMVETAIILPVVLLLIFGTMVVGLWLYEGVLAQVAANVGAWEGAKYYASHGLPGPEEVVGGVPSSFRNTYTDSGGPAHVTAAFAAVNRWLAISSSGLQQQRSVTVIEAREVNARDKSDKHAIFVVVEFDIPPLVNLPIIGRAFHVKTVATGHIKEAGSLGTY